MGRKGKRIKKNNRKKIIMILIIVVVIVMGYKYITNEETENASSEIKQLSFEEKFFENVETTIGEISEYTVYGTHFNIEGEIDLTDIAEDITDIDLVLIDLEENETKVDTEYEIDTDTITFSTGDVINEGLYLEELEENTYYLMLKVETIDEETMLYSLENDTDYGEIEYYTITKNSTNNKIIIDFSSYDSIPYLNFNVTAVSSLPDDVYDIVIDAGHGGMDVGSVSGTYYESEIVLDCALTLQEELEDLGYKVFLTRDGTEDEEENTAYNMYDDDGRVTLAMESNAKLLISLHMNSNTENLYAGGVEVYAPSNADLTFAKLLADNIVTMANTDYSYLETYKEDEGVYVRCYTESEIRSSNQSAISGGYEPYDNLTTETPYLYIIRETGGIMTGAFVDGRNTDYGTNEYYDSNVGIESYLIELGYIIVDDDLYNILYNQDDYMEAIATSITSYFQ